MSFLFQKQDPLNLLPENGLSKPLGNPLENLLAAFDSAQGNEQAYSEATVLRDQWGPIVDTINERAGMDAYSEFLGVKIRTFMHDGFTNPANNISSSILNAPATPGNAENQYMRAAQNIVDYLQENKDLFPDLQWVTHEEVLRRGMEVAQRERETLQDLEGRSPGFGNAIARFTGALGGLATDPINVETAFVGGAARSLYGAIFREAMLGAGVEAMSQAGVQEWYRTLGYEYTPEQFWTAVAMGGAFGGAMPVAFRAGGKTISLTTDQLKRGYQALRDSGAFTPTPVTRTAERQAEILEEEAAINPLADDAVHQERMEQATVATEMAEPAAMPDTPPAGLKPVSPELQRSYDAENANNASFDAVQDKIEALQAEQTQLDEALQDLDLAEAQDVANQQKARRGQIKDEIDSLREEQAAFGAENQRILTERETLVQRALTDGAGDNLDGLVYRFNPDEILVDADLFQFKAGGDEYGVSDRLRGIKIWDPVKAGQIVVYEFADGRRFIADGHQRLGLARRIKAEDPTQDVRLYGNIIREVDGITPEMARVIAAMKNIAEGTGTAIDAAKVLRVAPERIGELPPKSVLVRQAQGLTLLSDEAFGAVINGVVPANYAALVGRLIPEDEGLQSNAISVLAKTDPANEFQAEAIVRQVRDAGAERITQASLFGEEVITESYFTERARILDRAQKQLRQDKAAFGTLVRNAERLEAEGNQLARSANERRANNDTQAIALLQALANRKGPVSDALNAAARAARERGSYAEPTRNFVDAVRLAAESGDFDRISTGDVGQLVDAPTQSRTSKDVAERAVEDFDEPGGQGVRDQGDQLEQDLFGGAERKPDVEPGTIDELRNLIAIQADRAILDNHPVVKQALDEMKAQPETINIEGYGSEIWHQNRAYTIDNQVITGTKPALRAWEKQAEELAWKELKKTPEPVARNREASIILGPPAAGKSSIANAFAVDRKAAIIDSDEIKKSIPEFKGGIGASAVHEESSELSKILMAAVLARGTNVVIPKVGDSTKSILKLVAQLREQGYKVYVLDMNVSAENAYRRMIGRFVDTNRIIPPRYLDDVGEKPAQVYRELREMEAADGFAEIDNNGAFGAPKRILDIAGENPLEGTSLNLAERVGEVGGAADGRAAEAGAGVSGRGIGEETQPQKPFLDDQEAELDLDEEIPIGVSVDQETGELIAQTTTLRQVQDEIDQDMKMIQVLRECAQ